MSLFKTLQSSPAIVTLFHNKKVPELANLYKLLAQADIKINDDKQKFMIDLMENTIPTYDQYATIAGGCLKDNYSKQALQNCFPFVKGKVTCDDTGKVTINTPAELDRLLSRGMKMFNQGEYMMIYEAFNNLMENKSDTMDSINVFKPPLVVDWDQNLIANDSLGLQEILKKYTQ